MTAAKALGVNDQTMRNWVKATVAGNLNGAGSKVVTAEHMELSRLRAENARLKRENEIKMCELHVCSIHIVSTRWQKSFS